MTAVELTHETVPAPRRTVPEPRPAGFVADVVSIAGRALRGVTRDLEAVTPPIFIALFFFLVNIATLQRLTENQIAGFDFKAFPLPTAILLGVTGVSRAPALVLDVQNGYFDRLLVTPVRRLAILLGHGADVTVLPLIVTITISGCHAFASRPACRRRAFIAIGACGAWILRLRNRSRSRPAPAEVNRAGLCSFPSV